MPNITTLFRLWARPTPKTGRIIEILAVEPITASSWCLVRFSPDLSGAKEWVPGGSVPDQVPSIHDPDHNDVVRKAWEDGQEAMFSLAVPAKQVANPSLTLDGIFALDQYDKGKLDLRLPLMMEGSQVSFTRVGMAPRFDLKLMLALPAPLAVQGTKVPAQDHLHMTLTYAAALSTKADPLEPVSAVLGNMGKTKPGRLGSFGLGGGESNARMHNYQIAGAGGPYSLNGNLGPDVSGILARAGLGCGETLRDGTTRIEFGTWGGQDSTEWTYRVVCHREIALSGARLRPVSGVVAQGNTVALNLPEMGCELGLVGSGVTAEVEYYCILKDMHLWDMLQGKASVPEGAVDLRLRSTAKMTLNDADPTGGDGVIGIKADPQFPIAAKGSTVPFLAGGGLAEAARLQHLALRGLATTASQPQSLAGWWGFLDTIEDNAELLHREEVPLLLMANGLAVQMPMGASLALTGAASARLRITLDGLTHERESAAKPAAIEELTHAFDRGRIWPVPAHRSKPVRVSLPLLNTAETPEHDHRHRHIRIETDPEAALAPGADAPVFSFRLVGDPAMEVGGISHLKRFSGRIGALAFDGINPGGALASLLAKAEGTSHVSALEMWPRQRMQMDQVSGARGQPTLRLRLRYAFALSRVEPVTTDIAHGKRVDATDDLLISEGQTAADDQLRFVMEATESLDDMHDRHLQVTLIDKSLKKEGPPLELRTTVIAQQPFAIWRYARVALDEQGNADSADVAAYDSDARSWTFKASQDLYRLTLPPGVTGETTDKPGQFELHDASNAADILPEAEPSPEGVRRSRLVEMRLSPATDVWFDASDLPRNFLRPELAAQDLLAGRNDFGPGVALKGLRGELLHGLAFGLMVPADGTAPQMRLAEIAALSGITVAPPEAKGPGKALANRTNRALRAMARRPSRIEAVTVHPTARIPFRPATMNEGLRFALRQTALIQPPLGRDVDLPNPSPALRGPRMDKAGLAGGALWPIEQQAILRLLLENPVADGGTLDGFAISPHGASGDQAVEFDGGKVRILSQTRNGFVQRQRVEVMGRIAVLWHRARHVVVYERTTAASAQFAPEHGGATRSQRPILRKVEEFVEILQPKRAYPDDASGTPRATGFLREVRFNSRIIPVDSQWGRDLGEYGWEVPLWNRGAAARRPQVYPLPDVAFASTADEGGALVAQACLDPDALYFVTDTSVPGADTDNWPLHAGIDYPASGAPGLIEQEVEKVLSQAAATPGRNGRRVALPRALPGTRRFTWRLARAGQGVRINAERGQRPILAGLDSVTMSRKAPGVAADYAPFPGRPVGQVLDDRLTLGTADQVLASRAPWTAADAQPGGTLGDIGAALRSVVNGDGTAIPALVAILGAGGTDGPILGALSTAIGDHAQTLFGNSLPVFSVGNAVDAIVTADQSTCDRLARQAMAGIDAKRLLIRERLRAVEAELGSLPRDLVAVKAAARTEVMSALKALLANTVAPMNAVLDQAEATARAVLQDWRSDCTEGFARARARVDAFRNAYEKDRPALDHRFAEARRALNAELERLQDEALSALTGAQIRLSTGIDGAASGLAAVLTRAMRHALAGLDAGESGFDGIDQLLGLAGAPKQVVQGLDKAAQSLQAWIDRNPTHQHIQVALAARGALGAVQGRLAQLRALQSTVRNDLARFGQVLTDEVAQAHTALKAFLDATAEDFGAMVTALGDWATAFSTDALTALQPAFQNFDAFVDLLADKAEKWLTVQIDGIDKAATDGLHQLDLWLARMEGLKDRAADTVKPSVFDWPIEALTRAILAPLDRLSEGDAARIGAALAGLADRADAEIEAGLGAFQAQVQSQLSQTCGVLVGMKDKLIQDATTYAADFAAHLLPYVKDFAAAAQTVDQQIAAAQALAHRMEQAVQDIEACRDHARVYADRVLDAAAGVLSGGLEAAPGRALQLYAAAVQSPELAALKVKAERIRLQFEELSEKIKTSEVGAAFDKLGDALRGLGIDFRFDGLGDTFDFSDKLKDFDIGKLLPDFGGIKLDKLLPDLKVPDTLSDKVRISHDLDAKAGRAWVQIDVDWPIPGRASLFTLGPVTVNLRDSHLKARVRMEASKDSDKLATTDSATITTNIESLVGGQMIVSLDKTVIRYSSTEKLTFDLDPKGIHLHRNLQFVQDTLGEVFGDGIGGMRWIKEGGIPVGVEHSFALPPISVAFGTSGISNLALSNVFSLRAYPDFVIANSFALSSRELPFLFSFFILGGTGYARIDSEYRPFRGELGVLVTVNLGASAALSFAFGPVQGAVFITLSVELAYCKALPGSAGVGGRESGLTVSLVLVIAGNVRLFGIVTVYLGLQLSLSYHESGRIDAQGSLSVEVRISRFFKLRYSTRVTYKMRDGKSTRQVSQDTKLGGSAIEKARALNEARRML